MEARKGSDGSLVWSLSSDELRLPHGWVPVFGPALAPGRSTFQVPAARFFTATILTPKLAPRGRSHSTGWMPTGPPKGIRCQRYYQHASHRRSAGQSYFGFIVTGTCLYLFSPAGLRESRRTEKDRGFPPPDAVADGTISQAVTNSALALSGDSGILYVALSDGGQGTWLRWTAPRWHRAAMSACWIRRRVWTPASNNSSASPTVGPDGDVYFGVLESSGENHSRGWLLHFDAGLVQTRTPNAFGWDTTASVVPSSMVPNGGASSICSMTKYNDYAGAGGDGLNEIAIFDPNYAEALLIRSPAFR